MSEFSVEALRQLQAEKLGLQADMQRLHMEMLARKRQMRYWVGIMSQQDVIDHLKYPCQESLCDSKGYIYKDGHLVTCGSMCTHFQQTMNGRVPVCARHAMGDSILPVMIRARL